MRNLREEQAAESKRSLLGTKEAKEDLALIRRLEAKLGIKYAIQHPLLVYTFHFNCRIPGSRESRYHTRSSNSVLNFHRKMKDKGKLPKAFVEDGLDFILDFKKDVAELTNLELDEVKKDMEVDLDEREFETMRTKLKRKAPDQPQGAEEEKEVRQDGHSDEEEEEEGEEEELAEEQLDEDLEEEEEEEEAEEVEEEGEEEEEDAGDESEEPMNETREELSGT